MASYGNNKGRFRPIILLISFLIASFLLYNLALGYYKAKYTESAHGNNPSGAGVNRSATSIETGFGYSRGNCTHCHEAHASIGGDSHTPYDFELFAPNNPTNQNNNFCFQCHKFGSTIQAVTNYTYSKNFGGGTETFNNIYDAFNPATGSSHNLADVLNHAIGRNIGFTNKNNACIVCHDPHTAQKNYEKPITINPKGGVKTAIRHPYDYKNNPNNLWGDEDYATSGLLERMIDYSNKYVAPYYKDGAPLNRHEPANDTIDNGSNLPNFVDFCRLQCHAYATTSTDHGRPLDVILWGPAGNQHGRNHNSGGLGITKPPYGDENYNYVLSCTDCHEPHGSRHEYLLRTSVNGKDNISIPGSGKWLDFCTACHTIITQHPTQNWDANTDCYGTPGIGNCHSHDYFF